MKILIIGAGAMGSCYGAALAEVGCDVWLYTTNEAHVKAINESGLEIEYHGETRTVKNLKAVTDMDNVDTPDVAFLFTKTTMSEAALKTAGRVFDENTRVVTLQNGIGNVETVEKFVPIERIIEGMTTAGANIMGPGKILINGKGLTEMATAVSALKNLENIDQACAEKTQKITEELADYLNKGRFHTEIPTDIVADIWQKLIFNCAFNSIGFITELPQSAPGNVKGGDELCFRIIREAGSVAFAEGINVNVQKAVDLAKYVFETKNMHRSSMLEDRVKGRICESEGIMGNVLRLGERHGLDLPCLNAVYLLVKIIENGAKK